MTRAERPFAPRRLVHRGSVLASGFLLDDALVGARARCRRVLEHWRPGATLRRLESGRWWLRLPAPARVRVDEAPGTPLVAEAGLVVGAPGLAVEARRRQASDGSAVLLRAGAVEIVAPTTGDAVDPSRWLDLGAFERIEVRGAAALAVGPTPSLGAVGADVRAMLGGKIPPATAEAQRMAHQIARRLAGQTDEPAGRPPLQLGGRSPASAGEASGASGASGAPDEPSPLVRWLAGMFRALSAALTSAMLRPGSIGPSAAASRPGAASAAGGTEPAKGGLVVRPVEPAGPTWLQRVASRLDDLAARMLLSSRLASTVGKKQADYLDRMMQMFEQGNLDEALRHAIPLAGDGEESAGFSLGIPRPRTDLGLSAGASGSTTTMLPFAGLHDELNRLYRAAFERLDGEGRVEEAAFVLAELLHRSEEAVAYLERHEKFRLAAELAEGRKLPAGLVVRQWFLADDVRRAVLLARRHGAFADAVLRLTPTHPDRARVLRLLWAETLAGAGDFLTADRVVEEMDEARPLRLAWLELALAPGGTAALTALVRRLALDPGTFEDAARRVTPLLSDLAPEAAAERLALAGAIQSTPGAASVELRALARPLLRALLRDTSAGPEPGPLGRLREVFSDGLLRADWPAPLAAAADAPVEKLTLRETAPGTVAVRDAALLPGGRWLVALGEAGVLLLSREGRRAHHFDQPADRLIVSHHGDRALALAARGSATRLARLDLNGRRAQAWAEAELSCWAPDFDGASWLMGTQDGALCEIDTLADGWSSLWRLRDLGGRIVACGRVELAGEALGVLIEGPARELWLWQFGLDTRALRRRDEVSPPRPAPRPGVRAPLVSLGPTGVLVWEASGEATVLRPGLAPLPLTTTLEHQGDAHLSPLPHGFLLATGAVGQAHAVLGSHSRLAAATTLDDVTRQVAHATPAGVALADDRGRLLALRWDAAREAPRWVRTVRL